MTAASQGGHTPAQGALTVAQEDAQRVGYEWLIEEVSDGDTDDHEDGEVLECYHEDTAVAMFKRMETAPPAGTRYAYGLVRNIWSHTEGVIDRAWCYVEDGELPAMFSDSGGADSARVPKKLRAEYEAARAALSRATGSQP